jgi:hypothetical protein
MSSSGSLRAPYGTWSSPITTEAITKAVCHDSSTCHNQLKTSLITSVIQANAIVDVIVDPVTSEVYHIESRPSEKGRCVLVHTESDRDIVGVDWNVRTAVQEYGGAAAIVHDSLAYFSHVVDGRIYRVRVGGESAEPEPITPGAPNIRTCMRGYFG